MMPRGIRVILLINVVVLIAYIATLFNFGEALRHHYPAALYVALVTVGTLLVQQLVMLLKFVRMMGFIRLMVYVLAILQGLQVMLVIKDIFTIAGFGLVMSGAVLAFYFIGMRGYLGSANATHYFTHQS